MAPRGQRPHEINGSGAHGALGEISEPLFGRFRSIAFELFNACWRARYDMNWDRVIKPSKP